jgi:nitroreductase
MEFYEVIKARRSIRAYQSTPIAQDKLDRLWESVRWAPSACNQQPWRFLVLKSVETRTRLKGILQDWAFSAPLIIVGLGNRKSAWCRDGESIHALDVTIATEHLMLAATAEGLGTCWICAFDRKALHRVLGLSPDWDPVVVTPLGYPDDPSPRTERKAVSEIIQVL